MVSKVKVGFHRIGLSLVAISLIIGGLILIAGAILWGLPIVSPPNFEVRDRAGSTLIFRYGTERTEIGRALKAKYQTREELDELIGKIEVELAGIENKRSNGVLMMKGSVISLIVAAILYTSFWALGWIISGFVGD